MPPATLISAIVAAMDLLHVGPVTAYDTGPLDRKQSDGHVPAGLAGLRSHRTSAVLLRVPSGAYLSPLTVSACRKSRTGCCLSRQRYEVAVEPLPEHAHTVRLPQVMRVDLYIEGEQRGMTTRLIEWERLALRVQQNRLEQ